MPSEIEFNDSPSHFMILDAIGGGIKTANKISKVTQLEKAQVEPVLNDLVVQLLVVRVERAFSKKDRISYK